MKRKQKKVNSEKLDGRTYSKRALHLFMRLGPESAAMLADLVADRQASMPDHHVARAAVVREAIRSLHETMIAKGASHRQPGKQKSGGAR